MNVAFGVEFIPRTSPTSTAITTLGTVKIISSSIPIATNAQNAATQTTPKSRAGSVCLRDRARRTSGAAIQTRSPTNSTTSTIPPVAKTSRRSLCAKYATPGENA